MDATQSVEQIRWNLSDLIAGAGEDPVGSLLDEALERAGAFAERYRGALATIDGDTDRAAVRSRQLHSCALALIATLREGLSQ